MKSKQKSMHSAVMAKGGSGHMVGKQAAGQQIPGGTANNTSGGGGKFAKGGSGHMVGKQTASPAKPC